MLVVWPIMWSMFFIPCVYGCIEKTFPYGPFGKHCWGLEGSQGSPKYRVRDRDGDRDRCWCWYLILMLILMLMFILIVIVMLLLICLKRYEWIDWYCSLIDLVSFTFRLSWTCWTTKRRSGRGGAWHSKRLARQSHRPPKAANIQYLRWEMDENGAGEKVSVVVKPSNYTLSYL